MDEVDDLLMNFKFNNLALQEYGRYRNGTFTPWSHGLDHFRLIASLATAHSYFA